MTFVAADGLAAPEIRRAVLMRETARGMGSAEYGAFVGTSVTRGTLARIALRDVAVLVEPAASDRMHAVGPSGRGLRYGRVTRRAFDQNSAMALELLREEVVVRVH